MPIEATEGRRGFRKGRSPFGWDTKGRGFKSRRVHQNRPLFLFLVRRDVIKGAEPYPPSPAKRFQPAR